MNKTVEPELQRATVMFEMMVWDIMGEKGFRALLRDAYFEGSHGVIAVCDLTRKDSFYDLNNWVQMIRKQVGNVPIEFLANKVDLKDQMDLSEADIGRSEASHIAKNCIAGSAAGQRRSEE